MFMKKFLFVCLRVFPVTVIGRDIRKRGGAAIFFAV
jgi:hypothetical protein